MGRLFRRALVTAIPGFLAAGFSVFPGCGTEGRNNNDALAAALGARNQLTFIASCNTASANSVCRNVYRSTPTTTIDCTTSTTTAKCPDAAQAGRCILTGSVSGGAAQDEYVYYTTGGLPYSSGTAETNCTGDLKGTYSNPYVP